MHNVYLTHGLHRLGDAIARLELSAGRRRAPKGGGMGSSKTTTADPGIDT